MGPEHVEDTVEDAVGGRALPDRRKPRSAERPRRLVVLDAPMTACAGTSCSPSGPVTRNRYGAVARPPSFIKS
jgi:hypothetical protein